MGKIIFGTAGNVELDVLSSFETLKQNSLMAQEIEFVRGVVMGNETAKIAGAKAEELGIRLSIHAPFYINLSSEEPDKIIASKKRILDSCERAYHLKAKYVVFHAGYYGKKSPEEIYEQIKKEIIDMQNIIKQNGWNNVLLAPETTGKRTQFGSLDELLKLKKETGCSICVDFAHLLARDGKIDYKEVFDKLDNNDIKELHCHFSGIIYGDKGEQKHRLTTKEDLIPLLSEAKKHDIILIIINESPDPLNDALLSKELFENL